MWTLWLAQVASLSHLTSDTCVWTGIQAKKQPWGAYHSVTISPVVNELLGWLHEALGLWRSSAIIQPEDPYLFINRNSFHYLPPFLYPLGPLCFKRDCWEILYLLISWAMFMFLKIQSKVCAITRVIEQQRRTGVITLGYWSSSPKQTFESIMNLCRRSRQGGRTLVQL